MLMDNVLVLLFYTINVNSFSGLCQDEQAYCINILFGTARFVKKLFRAPLRSWLLPISWRLSNNAIRRWGSCIWPKRFYDRGEACSGERSAVDLLGTLNIPWFSGADRARAAGLHPAAGAGRPPEDALCQRARVVHQGGRRAVSVRHCQRQFYH